MLYNNNDVMILPTVIQSETVTKFIDYLDVRPRTTETYSKALQVFLRYLHSENIKTPNRGHIVAYRDYLRSKYKPSTVQTYIIAVRLFFKYLSVENIFPNIADHIKGAKISKEHKKDALTTFQIKSILKNIDRKTLTGKRDYALFILALTGGLRTLEISRANIDDLRTLGNHNVLYIQGKGQDERTDYIKLSPKVEEAIRDYLKFKNKPTQALFTSTSNNNQGGRLTTRSISSIIKNLIKKGGYDSDRLTAHSLRHTAATLNLLNGGTLDETQQLLRHTNINTTMIYVHHLDRIKNQSEKRIADCIFK